MANATDTSKSSAEVKSARMKELISNGKRGGVNSLSQKKEYVVMEPIIAKTPLKDFAALTPKDMGDMGILISTSGEVMLNKGAVLKHLKDFREHSSYVLSNSDFEIQLWKNTLDKLEPYQAKYVGETSKEDKKVDKKEESSENSEKESVS